MVRRLFKLTVRWLLKRVRSFTLKGFVKTVLATLLITVIAGAGFLWMVSNHPSIPASHAINEYRFLNPSADKVCVNPDPSKPGETVLQPSYQGWCAKERQDYYRLPQGTDFFGLQYDWISNLERPMGKKALVTRDFMQRLGYIYDPANQPNENNPYDLPIGLTWHYADPADSTSAKILDVSCAACHSSQITYKGTALVIDGGAGMHALPSLQTSQFMPNVVLALSVTYLNPFKFNRFAKKVLKDVPESDYSAAKKQLRADTWASIKSALHYSKNNVFLNPTKEGYGRTDALGRIANTVFGDDLSSANYHKANAPVSYPHLWDIWAFDWVQWMGSVRQAMARNVNQALGTRAQVNLKGTDGLYDNSVLINEIHCLETTLQHLEPPSWPEDLFGSVDAELASEGEQIFTEVCASCHGPFKRKAVNGKIDYAATAKNHSCTTCHGPLMTSPDGEMLINFDIKKHPGMQLLGARPREQSAAYSEQAEASEQSDTTFAYQTQRDEYWEMIHIPLDYIGTDPHSALNMINNTYDVTPLIELVKQKRAQGSLLRLPTAEELPDPGKASFAGALKYIGGEVRSKQYREWGLLEADGYTPKPDKADVVADLNGFGEADNPVAWRAYRPRPLEGVWATAPFLHNGSVPSIYQLLLPAEERDTQFYMGSKEFNPQTLGLEVGKIKGAFKLDTTVTGNSNMGHEFNDGLCGDGVIGYQLKDRPGYCRQLTERERWAIIEYLKIHSDGKRPNPWTEPHCSAVDWPQAATDATRHVPIARGSAEQISGGAQ